MREGAASSDLEMRWFAPRYSRLPTLGQVGSREEPRTQLILIRPFPGLPHSACRLMRLG